MKKMSSLSLVLCAFIGSVYSSDRECVIFTGKWTGQCKTDQGSQYKEMTISQTGCESITWDGDYFVIGKETIISKTNDQGMTFIGHVFTEWTPDKSQINMKEDGVVSHPALPNPLDYKGYAWIRVNDGRLYVFAAVTSVGGQPMDSKQECLLDKKE